MIRTPLLLLGTLVLFVGCTSQPAPAPSAVVEIEQWSGQLGGSETPKTHVLRTAEEWNAFWQRVDRKPPRPLQAAEEMAVVVELGMKRTGGYTASILRTGIQDGKLVVDYREAGPEPGLMVIQAFTSPWVAAVLPRSDLPVVFQNMGARSPARREK